MPQRTVPLASVHPKHTQWLQVIQKHRDLSRGKEGEKHKEKATGARKASQYKEETLQHGKNMQDFFGGEEKPI